jgi:hypothetical protein
MDSSIHRTNYRLQKFAAIVPVGPGAVGLWRGVETIRSLVFWQPDVSWCVILDDAETPRGLSAFAAIPPTCQAITIMSPPRKDNSSWIGRLTGGILGALSWIQSNTEADFVLRIDTDALVIAPFAREVHSAIDAVPEAGVIGTVGLSSHPSVRARENHQREPKLLKTFRLLPEGTSASSDAIRTMVQIEGVGRFDAAQRRAFDVVRPHIEVAIRRGYRYNHFCQGGIHVVSRLMLDRMADRGFFACKDAWAALPFADDRVMAMYARASDVRLQDCSGPGEPFGVQSRGLPFSPQELVRRGHSLIHSVKNDRQYSESDLRDFFRARMLT